MTSNAASMLVKAVAYLEERDQDIIFRWVQIASRLPMHFRRPDESLKQLIDHMPDVLVELRRLILESHDPFTSIDIPEAIVVAHAETRYRQNIPRRVVVKEYQILRRQVWATLRRWPQARELSAEDIFLLEERINFVLDEFIAATLDTFVDLENEGDGHAPAEPSDNPGR